MQMFVSLVLVVVLTVLGWWISERFQFGRQLGTTMVVLLIGFSVTNLFGWQPDDEASGWISGPLTSLAITQLLLAVDLRRLWPDARRLVVPFAAAIVFTVIGLSSPLAGLLGEGWPVLAYASVVVAVHGIGVFGLRRWRHWPLAETLVASQAAIGGPSTALALASSMGRGALALPSVAIGLLGYLLGTYLGLMAAAVLSAL